MASNTHPSDEYIDGILEKINSQDQSEEAFIAQLQKAAKGAKPYPYNHVMMRMLDGEPTTEEWARIYATSARISLERKGIPVDEE